jgi:hypothetical protein
MPVHCAFSQEATAPAETLEAFMKRVEDLMEEGKLRDVRLELAAGAKSIDASEDKELLPKWQQETMQKLIVAWSKKHAGLVSAFHHEFPASVAVPGLHHVVLTREEKNLLQEIVESVGEAHHVLESLEPSLGSKPAWNTSAKSTPAADSDDNNNSHETEVSNASNKTYLPLLCSAVLEMWGKTVRASARGRYNEEFTRGIPQRVRFLLQQMILMGIPPTIHDHNRAIETWAFSKEHMRASKAERMFEDMEAKKMNTAESRRLVLWAWALSRERRAAYRSTGHLMKMFRSLRDSDDDEHAGFSGDIEPSLSDYHVVLKAWARAE